MAAGNGEKEAMAAEKGASVGENGKGEEGAVASERAAATEKGKAVEEEEEVAGVTMITVKSMDGEERRLSVAAAERSGTLRGMIEDGCVDQVIPLRNVFTGRTLDTVIEYCTKHAAEAEPVDDSDPSAAAGSSSGGGGTAVAEDLKKWDRKLVEGLDADDLYDILEAANFLDIKGLLDVVLQKAADMIKGKTTREIRRIFNLPDDDLTAQDVWKLRQHFAWGFEEWEPSNPLPALASH